MLSGKQALITLYALLLSQGAIALEEDSGLIESATATLEETENLHGIIFDRTITQTGFSFYQEFNRQWLEDASSSNHTLTVRETPTARQGSLIWIEEGSTLLHRLSIGLHNKNIAEKADASLQTVRQRLNSNRFNTLPEGEITL